MMLRRILLQLSAQSPHPYTVLRNQYTASSGQKLPTYQELVGILTQLLRELGPTYIILDALDECDDEDFAKLFDLVSTLRAWKETPLHLMITSQPRDIFTENFEGVPRITLNVNIIQKEIEVFLAGEIRDNRRLKIWRPHATEIVDQIMRKSNGM
jgi:hypothetical protein